MEQIGKASCFAYEQVRSGEADSFAYENVDEAASFVGAAKQSKYTKLPASSARRSKLLRLRPRFSRTRSCQLRSFRQSGLFCLRLRLGLLLPFSFPKLRPLADKINRRSNNVADQLPFQIRLAPKQVVRLIRR